jgi:hypothetical protein
MSELKGTATAEQISEWKQKYGDVFRAEVDDSVCYLKKPDRKTRSYVAALGSNPIRANEALLENCWLGGDESIKRDDEKFFGISSKLSEIVQVKDAEITKL